MHKIVLNRVVILIFALLIVGVFIGYMLKANQPDTTPKSTSQGTSPFKQQTEDPFVDAGDELKICLIKEMGEEAYQAVATKQRGSTAQEIEILKKCIDLVNSDLNPPQQ